MFHCEWCKETIDCEYMVFWRIVNGKKVDVTFLHLECEEDFMDDTDKKYWVEKFFPAEKPIYINPVVAKWRAAKD